MANKKVIVQVFSPVDIGLLGLSRMRKTETFQGEVLEEDLKAFKEKVKA